MKSLKNKVVVITGAGSGIGQALALQVARMGGQLAINDWNQKALLATKEQILQEGGSVSLHRAFDVSNRALVYQFAEEVASTCGQVDVVINNAGIALPMQSIEATSYEDYERVININLWGVIYGSKAFIPILKKRPEAAVVNVSSIFGAIGYYHQGPYVTTKFAVRGFTETLRQELSRSKIQVSVVMPGGINTNIVRNIDLPDSEEKKRLVDGFAKQAKTSPEKAAQQIITGIQKKKRRIFFFRFF